MSANNDPKSADKDGSDKIPAKKKPKTRTTKHAKSDAQIKPPVIKYVPARALAKWPVHPLADRFRFMTQEKLIELGESMAERQVMPIVAVGNMILDGRNRIKGGEIKNLLLCVAVYENLSEPEIEQIITSLNARRRSDSVKEIVRIAAEYYAEHENTVSHKTLDQVAKMFGISRRSLCRYRENQKKQPKPPKPRASFDRIPPDMHDVAVAISHMWVFKDSATGRYKHKRFRAEFREIANEFMSEPEMQRFLDGMNRNIGVQDNPQDDSQDDSQDDPQDDPQDDLEDDVTS